MTTPRFTDAPLLTDADVLARVRDLVGHACTDSQLWLFLIDGDGRQAPVVMPIGELPERPDAMVTGLAGVLAGVRDMLVTDLGPGSVVLTLERLGPPVTTPEDREWAAALVRVCVDADVGLRGVFLSTRAGVRRLA